ncbi:hypothetical protein ACH4OY_28975 [Micromonospora rubida]|uniref:Uncharacterized protein n=1 Tax=Micromonospora rubida TaxID=2697657 RepID=A0ABW7SV40_9ACTN
MTTLIVRLRGESPAEEVAATGDDTGTLVRIIASLDPARYPYLAYVDPFGLTVFNRLQMDVVVPELVQLKTEEGAGQIGSVINQVIQFATQCRDEVHLYLKDVS